MACHYMGSDDTGSGIHVIRSFQLREPSTVCLCMERDGGGYRGCHMKIANVPKASEY